MPSLMLGYFILVVLHFKLHIRLLLKRLSLFDEHNLVVVICVKGTCKLIKILCGVSIIFS